MYRVLKIEGEEYKLEFSVEASLYNDCVQKVTGLMLDVATGQNDADLKQILSAFADVPNAAITCFFAGLLEHHGSEADGRVPNIKAAKKLAVSLIRDKENSDVNNWYDLFTLCATQMGEDGFFELIGLGEMLGTEKKRPMPVPQDHKRKQRKTTEASEK